jgi:hypothetical protein
MKLVQASLLGFVVAATALGQRGAPAGHAGSAHASAGFSSGRSFSMSVPSAGHAYGSAPAYRPNLSAQPRSLYTSPIGPPPFGGTQPITGRRYPYPNNGYRPYYHSRGVYLVPGFLNYGYGGYGYGYPDDSYSGDQQQAAPADSYAQAPPPDSGYDEAYGQAPPRQPYQPQAAPAAEVPDQPEITLLFKDGRTPQQVQNYAVTRTTLYVLDGAKRREIPLDELDLPQTEKTNRDAGLDFEVPAGAE